MLDQARMLYKVQKELGNEVVEVEAGNGAVLIQITGTQKVKKVKLDPELIDADDLPELERWLESAFREAITRSQQLANDKMKPFLGKLGKLGL